MRISATIVRRRIKPAVFVALLLPLVWLVWNWYLAVGAQPSALGANPIEFTNRYLGDWSLKYIVGGLALTPLSVLTKSKHWIVFRRMVGLFAFFFVILHVSSYVVLDHFFDWTAIWKDIVKRTFITIGMISLLLLIPMAMTSTAKMIKRLGGKRWRNLHRSIYVIGPLVVVHYNLMVKGNQLEPLLWGGALAVLLLFRLVQWRRKRARAKPAAV